MSKKRQESRPGKKLVVVRWVINKKTGKRIYPKNGKCFAFWVDA